MTLLVDRKQVEDMHLHSDNRTSIGLLKNTEAWTQKSLLVPRFKPFSIPAPQEVKFLELSSLEESESPKSNYWAKRMRDRDFPK